MTAGSSGDAQHVPVLPKETWDTPEHHVEAAGPLPCPPLGTGTPRAKRRGHQTPRELVTAPGAGTDLLRAHGIHPGHLQRVHLHLSSHGVHVLDVGVSSRHGDSDAHVVVHALLSRRWLVLSRLAENAGKEGKKTLLGCPQQVLTGPWGQQEGQGGREVALGAMG